MKRTHRLSLLCASVMLASTSTTTLAQSQFDQILVFGASYLDSGTFLDAATGNSAFRFTNNDPVTGERGLALSEILSDSLGLGSLPPATPQPFSLVGSTGTRTDGSDDTIGRNGNINFAVGGAQTDDILDTITGSQGLNQGIASNSLSVSSDALFLVNLGGNDIRALDDPSTTAAASLNILQELVNAGAQNIVALNLPQLGELSEGANVNPDGTRTAIADARTAGAEQFNSLVDAGLSSIDANIIRADVASLFSEVLANPGEFGFSTTIDQTSECFGSPFAAITSGGCAEGANGINSATPNPDDFVFEDGLHPTQRTAQITSDYIESLLRAPGQISLIAETGYLALAQHQSSLRSELSASRFTTQPVKSYRFFSNINTADNDIAQTSSTFAANNDSDSGNIGFTYQYNESWTLGLALGYLDQDVDIDATGTSFESDGFLISALAAYRKGNLFLEGGITLAEFDVESNRGVTLGIAQRVERGDTDADGLGLNITLGYDLLADKNWRIGPIARLDYSQLDVDSFSEDGTSSTSLSFSNIERDALIASLGAFANAQSSWGNIPVQYFGEVSLEADLAGDPDDIRASLNSLDSAPSFELEGFDTDSVGFSAQFGISAALTKGLNAQLSYTYRDIGGDLDSINFGLNAAF